MRLLRFPKVAAALTVGSLTSEYEDETKYAIGLQRMYLKVNLRNCENLNQIPLLQNKMGLGVRNKFPVKSPVLLRRKWQLRQTNIKLLTLLAFLIREAENLCISTPRKLSSAIFVEHSETRDKGEPL